MKTYTNDDCYEYMRMTHVLALCWGLPITRIRTNNADVQDRDTTVQGNINCIFMVALRGGCAKEAFSSGRSNERVVHFLEMIINDDKLKYSEQFL